MNKKYKFLHKHHKIYDIYCILDILIYKIKRIGKSGDCKMCGYCKNNGCLKNKIAEKFKLAGCLGCKCYKQIKNKETTEQ